MPSPCPSAVVLTALVSSLLGVSVACSGGEATGEPAGGDTPATIGAAGTLTVCGTSSVDTRVDGSNCGACRRACDAGEVCSNGVCALSCGRALETCHGGGGVAYCADLQTDNANCGACGSACPNGTSCQDGSCATTCGSGNSLCAPDGGATYCANLETARDDCGTCRNACAPGHVCAGGSCAVSCQAGLVDCSGTCIDPETNPSYCGASGTCGGDAGGSAGAACAPTEACVGGKCVELLCDGACAPGACVADVGCGKRVFATSQLFNGNVGGLAGADARCQKLAETAGLPGSYKAWLSDSTGSPSTRFVLSTIPYRLVDGTLVANDWDDLTDRSLVSSIGKTEKGGAPPQGTACNAFDIGPMAWSNTTPEGALYLGTYSCADWTSAGAGPGDWGRTLSTDPRWSAASWSAACSGSSCGRTAVLYCFEQ